MPVLVSKSEVKVEWTDLEKWVQVKVPKSARRRSSGTHLSGIIRHVLINLGKLNTEDLTDEMPLCMCVGMAWENWVVGLAEDGMVWQPGEWEKDGVYGTPDGTCIPEYVDAVWPIDTLVLEEFKATWKSKHTHGDVLKESVWMWQLAGNCAALHTLYARLHVLWVNGNYRPPSPKYYRYLVKFEQQELDKFWQNVVLRNKDAAPKEQH